MIAELQQSNIWHSLVIIETIVSDFLIHLVQNMLQKRKLFFEYSTSLKIKAIIYHMFIFLLRLFV